MFGLRSVVRSSVRLFTVKSVEKTLTSTRQCRLFQQALQNDKLDRNFCTQTCENTKTDETNAEKLVQHPVGKLKATRMRILFTCKKCSTRNDKTMSKQAYETGVVLIRCDGCQNNHLIADNLGWFGVDQRKRNIEWIMKHKGETVKRLTVYGSDSTEFVPKTGDIANEEEKIKQIDVKIAES